MTKSSLKKTMNKPLGKRQLSKAKTREKILKVARSEFAKKGYHGTSIRELATLAGVSTGAFYGNFTNKRAIFNTIIDEIYITLKSIIDQATQDLIHKIKDSPSGRLTSILVRKHVGNIFRLSMDHVDLFDILRREGLGRDPEFYRRFNKVWESLVDAVRRALQAYVEAGITKSYDTDLVARAIVPMAISMMIYAKKSKKNNVEDVIDTVSAMIDGGILSLTYKD